MHNGSVLDWAASYAGEPFHAALMDPPYHLTEIGRTLQMQGGSVDPRTGRERSESRARGFMGKTWDGGDIAFRSETWAALAQHLHPGAYGMAFASTRGYHRMACAIEDAGLIIHTMLGWSFGSGFPKATRIDTQIDRRAGAQPRVVGTRKHAPKFNAKAQGYREKDNGFNSRDRQSFDVTEPATNLAAAWQGHRYGGQAIKPAFEPIVVFQKPYQGKPVDSITRTGAGALNIDGGRVASTDDTARRPVAVHGVAPFGSGQMGGQGHDAGRWPSNLLLSHNPDCSADSCSPGCAVAALGDQSGDRPAGNDLTGSEPSPLTTLVYGAYDRHTWQSYADEGTAARFFYNADYFLDRIDNPVRYVAKASTAEREAGLDGWQPTTVDDGRAKSIDNPYLRGETERRNTHPTVKPIDLCRYLATLLLPPGLYAPRRILIPFSGSGSEMIGAGLAGWEVCQGIELEAEHIAIARARLGWWIDIWGTNHEAA
jgi:hypothetical protein